MLLHGTSALETIVTKSLESSNTVIVTLRYSLFESFNSPITDSEVQELSAKYPSLDISNDYVEADFTHHILFYSSGGSPWCFDYEGDEGEDAFIADESEWKFSTNHDSYWRENAFRILRKKIEAVRNPIYEIHNSSIKYSLQDILIPKHIVPNFCNVDVDTKTIKFDLYLGARENTFTLKDDVLTSNE